MNIGALADGAAEGFTSGYRTGILGANLKHQQTNEDRRMKLAEEQGARQAELQGLQIGEAKRRIEREQALDAAHRQALQIMSGATGAPMDPNAPPDQQVARFVVGGLNDPRTLSAVAKVYSDAGHPEAGKWIERGYLAKREGVLDFADAVKRGQYDEAAKIYNSTGDQRIESVRPEESKEGPPTGRVRVRFADGSEETMDPDSIMKSVFSYSEWRGMQEAARKAQRETEKDAAEIKLKNAQAEKEAGENATKIRVAEIGRDGRQGVAETQVDGRITVAGMRGAGGAGRGSGRGGGGAGDPWNDAKKRQDVLGAIDKMAAERYGERDPVKGDARHSEASRKISSVAAMLMRSSVEASRDNPQAPVMSEQEAVEIAAGGRGVWRKPVFDAKTGRYVSKEDWSSNGAVHPLPSAVVAAPKEVLLKHIKEELAPLAKQKKIGADQLRKADDIQALAKQIGMSVDEVVGLIVEAESVPQKGGASGGGITGGAGAPSGKVGATAPARRSGGITGEIEALEAKLSAIPDNGALSSKVQRNKIQGEIDRLRDVSEDRSNRDAVIPSQRVATAAKLRDLEARLANLKDDGRLSTSTQRSQLEKQIEELRSALRRSSGGGITREIRN